MINAYLSEEYQNIPMQAEKYFSDRYTSETSNIDLGDNYIIQKTTYQGKLDGYDREFSNNIVFEKDKCIFLINA